MKSIHVRLDEAQTPALQSLARREGCSLAATVRRAVDMLLESEWRTSADTIRARALAACGRFSSGLGDVSEHHDDYFVESIGV